MRDEGEAGCTVHIGFHASRRMQTLLYHLHLYRRLVGAQIRSQMQYRTSFIVDFVAAFFGNLLDFAAVAVFFTRFPAVGRWGVGWVWLVLGVSRGWFAFWALLCLWLRS